MRYASRASRAARTRPRTCSNRIPKPCTLSLACLLWIGGALLSAQVSEAQLRRGSRFDDKSSCQGCHSEIAVDVAVPHQPLADGSCSTCHEPHGLIGALRLTEKEPELCLECHSELEEALAATHQHPKAGSCTSCHDPHGSDHPAMLRQSERQLCLRCHDQGFDEPVVHAPAAEACSSCHAAHGAEQPNLLSASKKDLCESCHGDAGDISELHGGISLAAADCASCHPPHSAASTGLLRASVHPEMDCSLCHADPAEAAGDSSICLDCHETPASGPETTAHPPVEMGECLECHNPHTSDFAPLLSAQHRVSAPPVIRA